MSQTPGPVTCLGDKHSTHTTHAVVHIAYDTHHAMFPFALYLAYYNVLPSMSIGILIFFYFVHFDHIHSVCT